MNDTAFECPDQCSESQHQPKGEQLDALRRPAISPWKNIIGQVQRFFSLVVDMIDCILRESVDMITNRFLMGRVWNLFSGTGIYVKINLGKSYLVDKVGAPPMGFGTCLHELWNSDPLSGSGFCVGWVPNMVYLWISLELSVDRFR